MDLHDYQRLALRTEKRLPTPLARLEHALLGLITEPGELATEIKRMAIYEKPLDEARRAHMAEEIGDSMWYLAIAADAIDVQLDDFAIGATFIQRPALLSFEIAKHVGDLADAVLDMQNGSNPHMCAHISVTVGDLLRNLNGVARAIDIPLGDICQANINKLRERFPDAYSNEAAEARADKNGADARNS